MCGRIFLLWSLISCPNFSLLVGVHFLNESYFWVSVFLLLANLISRARLPAGFLITCLTFTISVEGLFLNKTPFWGKSFCSVSDHLFEFQAQARPANPKKRWVCGRVCTHMGRRAREEDHSVTSWRAPPGPAGHRSTFSHQGRVRARVRTRE